MYFPYKFSVYFLLKGILLLGLLISGTKGAPEHLDLMVIGSFLTVPLSIWLESTFKWQPHLSH